MHNGEMTAPQRKGSGISIATYFWSIVWGGINQAEVKDLLMR
jgi:hypothetical protein